MVLSVTQKYIEPSLWALDFLSIYCKCPSSGVMGSVSLSWVSRQRPVRSRECHSMKSFPNYQLFLLPTPSQRCQMSSGQQGKQALEKRAQCVCVYSDSSDLIPLMGSKLPLEAGRELQSIGLNPSLCSRIFILLHQLHAAVKPTQSTLGSLVGGKSLPRPLAERCSCHWGFLAPGTGQIPLQMGPEPWEAAPARCPHRLGLCKPRPQAWRPEVPMSWDCS